MSLFSKKSHVLIITLFFLQEKLTQSQHSYQEGYDHCHQRPLNFQLYDNLQPVYQ